MKKIITLLSLLLAAQMAFSQAKKPTLMVQPSDVWCNENGFTMKFDNQGTTTIVPDYKKAFQTDMDLALVITQINGMMAERGFPLKDLEATLKSVERRAAEDNMTTSKTSGASLAESPLDQIRKTAKADIILDLSWKVNTVGPKKSVTFILKGIDAYTDKQIAYATGTGSPSFSAEVPVLLQEAVVSHMDNFAATLMQHFEDLAENGREVAIDFKVFDNGSGVDFESEFGGEELGDIIDEWLNQNTVNHRYSKTDGSENYMYYEQVRMPLFNANGKALDTEAYVKELRKYLQTNYQIESKVMTKGLGKAVLVVGEK
ncbi:MAG: hypothetical protein II708_04415 [Paludibacteraceae bacterium]|nr:hypothetical protein [Paludibacteraceae bacterium]